jgi:hypothetical protein
VFTFASRPDRTMPIAFQGKAREDGQRLIVGVHILIPNRIQHALSVAVLRTVEFMLQSQPDFRRHFTLSRKLSQEALSERQFCPTRILQNKRFRGI